MPEPSRTTRKPDKLAVVLRNRLPAEAEIEGLSADDLLRALLERVPAPRA